MQLTRCDAENRKRSSNVSSRKAKTWKRKICLVQQIDRQSLLTFLSAHELPCPSTAFRLSFSSALVLLVARQKSQRDKMCLCIEKLVAPQTGHSSRWMNHHLYPSECVVCAAVPMFGGKCFATCDRISARSMCQRRIEIYKLQKLKCVGLVYPNRAVNSRSSSTVEAQPHPKHFAECERLVSTIFVSVDCFVAASVKLSIRLQIVRRFSLRIQKGIHRYCVLSTAMPGYATTCFYHFAVWRLIVCLLFDVWVCDACDRVLYFSWSDSIANWPPGDTFLRKHAFCMRLANNVVKLTRSLTLFRILKCEVISIDFLPFLTL